MRCLPPRPVVIAICAYISTLFSGEAQQLDPTRLGEGIRPLPGPRLFEEEVPNDFALEDENDFAPASPGDDDIGQQLILKDSERERWFSAQADTFSFWADNPANLSSGGDEDFLWGSQISLGTQPRLAERLYVDAFVSQQLYRYDENSLLDYEYLQASLGLIYLEPRLWDSIIFAQGQYGRTTSDNFGEDVLNSFSILAGIQKTVLFDRRNSLYVNLMGDWDVATDVDDLDHAEYIVDLAYRFKIMRDLVLSASYRFTWFDYNDVNRSDALNIMGVYLTYSPYKWMNLYMGGTFNINESNVDVFDYHATNLGGGVGIQIRF
ncbi:MAG: outer membrane beta-barrel protein [Opitutaceae bacterium]|nr:outer membrane beta-barrel protein [Verrucomicrobiales bacterium]